MPPKKFKRDGGAVGSGPYQKEGGRVVKTNPDGTEKFTLFYGNDTFLSNFFPSKFMVNDVEFNCTEQYFHYKKAVHFNDDDSSRKLLLSKSPREQKSLGRQVKNYDQRVWEEVGPEYMKEGIKAKFEQNADLKSQLLSTAGTTLVEASPRDRKWGIGLGVHNTKAADRTQWRGSNLLGKILTEVRDEIQNAIGHSSTAAPSSGET